MDLTNHYARFRHQLCSILEVPETILSRTQGTKIVSDGLKYHIFKVSLVDLQKDEVALRKSKLTTEDIQGKN